MWGVAKRHFSLVFCLLSAAGFLVLPFMARADSSSLTPLEAVNFEDKIKIKRWDEVVLIKSLVQEFVDERQNLDNLEKDAAFTLLESGARNTFANYLFFNMPVNVGKVVFKLISKIASLILFQDPSVVIEAFEQMTVSQANQYISDWLFQNELRVSSGNLKGSYPSCDNKNVWDNFAFPYIIVYRPMDKSSGEVAMEIYSSKTIDSPQAIDSPFPLLNFEWEGGICKIPPFLVRIGGEVKKIWWGAGFNYEWIVGPKIDIIFNEPVPSFTVKEVGIIEAQINNLEDWVKETGLTLDKIAEKLVDFFKKAGKKAESINPFTAKVSPNLPNFSDSGVNSLEINLAPLLTGQAQLNGGNGGEGEDRSRGAGDNMTGNVPVVSNKENGGAANQISPEDMQEMLDDISEKVDILAQEVAELTGKSPVLGYTEGVADGQGGGVGQVVALNEDDGNGEIRGTGKNGEGVVAENEDSGNELNGQVGQGQTSLSSIQLDSLSLGGGGRIDVTYPKILISEIQTAGLESAKDEFVELFNLSSEEVDLSGWYLQKKTETVEDFSTFASNNLFDGKKIPGKGYFLIAREGSSFASIADILTDNPLAKNNTLALKNPNREIADKVGWGEVNDFETTPAVNSDAGESLGREWSETDENYFDTDNNLNDFKTQTPTPKEKNLPIPNSEQEIAPVITPEQGEGSNDNNGNEGAVENILINEIQTDSVDGIGGTDDDWVELYNPTGFDISLDGWSIQKHSADDPCSTGKSFYKKNFSKEAIIPANNLFLIVSTKAKDDLKNIADMEIGWSLTDENTIYLVKNQEKISGGDDADIVDKVGFGAACFSETNPALNPPPSKSIERKTLGLDTNDNSADFQINENPTPTNSKGETILAPVIFSPIWQTFQNNNQRTGRAGVVGTKSGTAKEIADLGSFNRSKIATPSQQLIRSDGAVFYGAGEVGDSGVGGWGKVYVFNADKTLSWESADLGSPVAAISISADGKTIYVSSFSNGLIALDAENGTEKWRYYSDDMGVISSTGQDEAGNIYFTNNFEIDKFYSLFPDGTERWVKEGGPRGGSPIAGPAVAKDGSVYVVWTGFRNPTDSQNGVLRAYSSEGELKWEVWLDFSASGPTIGDDGNVYIVSGIPGPLGARRILYVFNSEDGALLGRDDFDWGQTFNPVNNQDGSFAIADTWSEFLVEAGGIYYYYPRSDLKVFDSQGKMIWQTAVEDNVSIDIQPIADSEGNIFLAKTIYKQDPYGAGTIPDFRRIDIVSPGGEHSVNSFLIPEGSFNGSFSIDKNGYIYFTLVFDQGDEAVRLKLYSIEP